MSRLLGVDTTRSIAILAVIAIHTTPFRTQSSPLGEELDFATVINQTARFAVPFFFVISGYFWAGKIKNGGEIGAATLAMAKRIAYLFGAWSLIYLLPWNIVDALDYGPTGPIKMFYWNIVAAFNDPIKTLLQGTKVHLWFLAALLCGLLLTAAFLRLQLKLPLAILAVTLYVIGLLGKSYAASPWGFDSDFNFRNGPFFALLLFVTGYLLRQKQPNDAWFPLGLMILILGIGLHFVELIMLKRYWGISMMQDYVVGTYFSGTGAAIMALSNNRFLTFCSRCASIGPLVLGMYASHYIFVELMTPLDRAFLGYPAWALFYPALVFLLSYLFASILFRFTLTRKLVA